MRIRSSLLLFTSLAIPLLGSAADAPAAPSAKGETILTEPLPPLNGKEVLMLTVDLPPGAASAPHRHNANVYVYILEGSVVMKTQDGPEQTLTVGQHFVERPSDIHTVSRNASSTARAKFLVFMIKDAGVPATVPAK
jgi:quercetin dioxygenase-like cupin family protein